MSKDQADLAILPSNLDDSLNWPVVAILRQNVMALIVPAPRRPLRPPRTPKAGETAASGQGAEKAKRPRKPARARKAAKQRRAAKARKQLEIGQRRQRPPRPTTMTTIATAPTALTVASGNKSDGDKLTKISQLSGKRVGIVTGNEATEACSSFVLSHYGVAARQGGDIRDRSRKKSPTPSKTTRSTCCSSPARPPARRFPSVVAAATAERRGAKFIDIDQADGIAKRNPAFDSVDIDAGTFGGNPPSPDDSLKSLSFAEYLVARKSLQRQRRREPCQGDLHIAAIDRHRDAGRGQDRGAVDRQGCRRRRCIPARWLICPTASNRSSTNTATIFFTAC